MLSLNETKAGEDYTVKWMTGMPETMDYIRSCKVREGEDVRVISRIFGGVIVLSPFHIRCISEYLSDETKTEQHPVFATPVSALFHFAHQYS